MVMPWCGEPGDGPVEERDAVGGVLDAGELAVGEPGVGVDGGVDVGVARPRSARLPVRGRASEHLVPTTVGDSGQLLHVDVDELTAAARSRSGGSPDRSAGPSTATGSRRDGPAPDAPSTPAPRRSRPGEPDRACGTGATPRSAARPGPGSDADTTAADSNDPRSPATPSSLIAAPPLVGALTGDVHRLGRRRDRPTRPRSADTTEADLRA